MQGAPLGVKDSSTSANGKCVAKIELEIHRKMNHFWVTFLEVMLIDSVIHTLNSYNNLVRFINL